MSQLRKTQDAAAPPSGSCWCEGRGRPGCSDSGWARGGGGGGGPGGSCSRPYEEVAGGVWRGPSRPPVLQVRRSLCDTHRKL